MNPRHAALHLRARLNALFRDFFATRGVVEVGLIPLGALLVRRIPDIRHQSPIRAYLGTSICPPRTLLNTSGHRRAGRKPIGGGCATFLGVMRPHWTSLRADHVLR